MGGIPAAASAPSSQAATPLPAHCCQTSPAWVAHGEEREGEEGRGEEGRGGEERGGERRGEEGRREEGRGGERIERGDEGRRGIGGRQGGGETVMSQCTWCD